MKTRKLGRSDLNLSLIGVGAWAIGGPWKFGWGHQDDTASLRTIDAALDLGINWIDTAAVYGLGHSEKIVGQALKSKRDTVILATKCGLVWNDAREVDRIVNAASVRKELENSLQRLGTDYIDLYQIHWPTSESDHLEVWHEMAKFVEEGKIRYAGVCNFNAAELAPLLDIFPVASLQPRYSMIHPEVAADVFPLVREHNIGVIPYGIMHHGLLTGKYDQEKIKQLPDDDWRKNGGEFSEPRLSVNLEFMAGLKQLMAERDNNTAHLAIAWVLAQREITSAIIGLRQPDQPGGIVAAADMELDAELATRLDGLLAQRSEKMALIEAEAEKA